MRPGLCRHSVDFGRFVSDKHARCSTPMVDLHCILEWKLVHSKEQFAERNNPEGVVRVDSECKFNAIDLVVAFCRNGRKHASKTLVKLKDRDHFSGSDIIYAKYPGSLHHIPLVSYRNAVKVMMLLPGENAKKNREKFAQILQQYFAGDHRLKEKLDKNKESLRLFHVLARNSFAAIQTAASHAQSDQTLAASATTETTSDTAAPDPNTHAFMSAVATAAADAAADANTAAGGNTAVDTSISGDQHPIY